MAEAITAEPTLEVLLSEDDWSAHLARETLAGLRADPPSTPPVWFYDAVGSALFDRITGLPEYYPTRAERRILELYADDIVAVAGARHLLELGAGSADKTRLLLAALREADSLASFIPVDCSAAALEVATAQVAADFPGLPIQAVVADFNAHLDDLPHPGERMVAFLGSTIGNFEPSARATFLADLAATLEPGETLLLGTDLVKSPERLVAAYDDAAGVTAEFNLNALTVMNRSLGADFEPDEFFHRAVWDDRRSRIEMHLVARSPQRVVFTGFDGFEVDFAEGGYLRSEISTKFTPERVTAELAAAGLETVGRWTDPEGDFLLTLARR